MRHIQCTPPSKTPQHVGRIQTPQDRALGANQLVSAALHLTITLHAADRAAGRVLQRINDALRRVQPRRAQFQWPIVDQRFTVRRDRPAVTQCRADKVPCQDAHSRTAAAHAATSRSWEEP